MTAFSRDFIELTPSPAEFTIMQWNVLAECYAYGFACATPDHLSWGHRSPLILCEITNYSPDIVCLEEVDHYGDFFSPALAALGYVGTYQQKRFSADGAAIFWKKDKFLLKKTESYSLGGNQLVLVVKLEYCATEFYVLVTHLKAGFVHDQIRCGQVERLLNVIYELEELPMLLCADLNAEPHTMAYQRLLNDTESFVSLYKGALAVGEPEFSLVVFDGKLRKLLLDYVWAKGFTATKVLAFPSIEDIGENGLPLCGYPSDHFSLVAGVRFN